MSAWKLARTICQFFEFEKRNIVGDELNVTTQPINCVKVGHVILVFISRLNTAQTQWSPFIFFWMKPQTVSRVSHASSVKNFKSSISGDDELCKHFGSVKFGTEISTRWSDIDIECSWISDLIGIKSSSTVLIIRAARPQTFAVNLSVIKKNCNSEYEW